MYMYPLSIIICHALGHFEPPSAGAGQEGPVAAVHRVIGRVRAEVGGVELEGETQGFLVCGGGGVRLRARL